MKKRIFLSLFILAAAFVNQLHAYQEKNGSTVFFADVLLWKLREGAADNWGQIITPSTTTQTITLLDVPFNWQAGFRIGAGYHCLAKDWDTLIAYTRYQTKKLTQATTTAGGIYSAYLANFYVNNADGANFGPNYLNAKMAWKFSFNTLDVELGKNFQTHSMLKLRPFIGLKTAIINQHIDTSWQNPSTPTNFNTATENLKNNFWGIGPYVGLGSTWLIYGNSSQAFNLFGKISGGLLSGHWRFKDHYQNDAPITVDVNSSNFNSAATVATGQFGLAWLGAILNNEVTVQLGYEAQVWFDQLQYYSFNMGRLNNLMSLQGALLDFTINF